MGIKTADKNKLIEDDSENGAVVPGGTPITETENNRVAALGGAQPPLESPIATAPQIEYIAQATTPKQTFKEWMSAGGYDPDKEYADAKNNLEYEYMQANSKYGENAERLAQMGLSSSGVSDIFQLGAFNSYLQNENDLAARRIEQMREYRNRYSQYEQGWQSGYDTDVATAHNLGLQYYDGTNGEYVSQILKNQGFSQDVINKTLTTLGTYDVNALPTIKQRIADEAAKTEANNKAITEGYAWALDNGAWNGNNAEELTQRLINLDYTEEQAAEIIKRLENDGSAEEIKNSVINEAYASYVEAYTPDTAERIRNELKGTRAEPYIKDIITKLHENYQLTPENQRPGYVDMNQIRAVAEKALIDSAGTIHNYDGSAEQKRLIKLALDSAGLGDYYEEIIGEYDDKLVSGLSVDKNGEFNGDITSVSLEGVFNAYKNASADDRERYRANAEAAVTKALDDETTLANAYNLVGIDRATWNGMSNWERQNSVINAVGEYAKSGLFDKNTFTQLASEFINTNFEQDDFVAYAYTTGYNARGVKIDDAWLKENKDNYADIYADSRGDHKVSSDIAKLINSWVSAGYIDDPYKINKLEIYNKIFGHTEAGKTGSAEMSTEGERGTLTVTLNGNTKDLPGEAVRDESVIELVKRQATGDGKVKFAFLTGENNKGLYAIDTETGVVLKVDKDDVALISMGKEPYIPAKGYYGK